MAHLLSFKGTDTIAGIVGAKKYYNTPMAGYSIPAMEHSTIISWGQEYEINAYENMIDQYAGPGKMYAIVADSYDLFNAVDNIFGGVLKDKIINSGGTLVVRPDSGDPTIIPIEVILRLMDKFGYTTNSKGYKTLPDCVRVIQGDGININSIKQILKNLDEHKLTLDNLVFGMGGGLLQHDNRDTFSFAMKNNSIIINDIEYETFKQPKTDSGKNSKKGVLGLYEVDGQLVTLNTTTRYNNLLDTVYLNGTNYLDKSLYEIRRRVNSYM
jgi:nicotinamide phosphoribosyltransferase